MVTDRILHALMFCPLGDGRWGLPCLFWGPPGVGKTAIIERMGRANGFHVETLSPGERGEGAFGVTPVPSADGKCLNYPAPDWTSKLQDGGIVFVDEITLAEPALQKYIMALIHARRIGSSQLGPRVRVIAAANAAEESAGGWDLAMPLANRMIHLDWEAPDAGAWGDWLIGGAGEVAAPAVNAIIEESRVEREWPIVFAKAAGIVSGYVRTRPDLLHKMPKPGDPAASRAWPSHRSWEMATRALAAADVHSLARDEREALLSGTVGSGVAGEMIQFLDACDLPNPADVLDGRVEFAHDPRRLDRTAAVLSSCAAFVIHPRADRRESRAAALWKIMAQSLGGAEDVAMPAARALCKAGFVMAPEAQPMLQKMAPFLRAVGTGPKK